jgi:RNA polymerase sigma-70 factor, ECF subfamily
MEDLGKFRNQGGFRTWLFTIARSRAMDHFRRRKPEIPLNEINLHAHEADPLTEVIRRDQVDQMRSNINQLHENDKDLIRLRYVSGLSFAEIGKVLNRSEGAVKKRLYRLIARLSDQMEIDHE